MRRLFFLSLLLTLSFSYYSPPLDVVEEHNNQTAEHFKPDCYEKDATYDDPIRCVNATAEIYPKIENRIFLNDALIASSYSYSYADEVSKSITDEHGCTSYFTKISEGEPYIFPNITLFFKNITATLDNTTIQHLPNILTTASFEGYNNTLLVEGDFTFIFPYILERTISSWTVCDFDEFGEPIYCCKEIVYPSQHINVTRNIIFRKNFTAERENHFLFLSKPIILEEWEENEVVEGYLFTTQKIYELEVFVDNNSIGKVHLYSYNITDEDDFWRITELKLFNESNITTIEYVMNSTPYLLNKLNHSFTYTYYFSKHYHTSSIGKKFLRVRAKGEFGTIFEENYSIFKRKFSYSPKNTSLSRTLPPLPGFEWNKVIIPFLGFLIFFLLFNSFRKFSFLN